MHTLIKKKDKKDEISNPFTDIEINLNFNLSFLRQIKNWQTEKSKDNISNSFPKNDIIG